MLAGVNGRRDTLYAQEHPLLLLNQLTIHKGGVKHENKAEAVKLEYLASPG